MRDEPEIFNTKEKYAAMASEARCILILLGFDGVLDFGRRAGINHETAGQLLGTVKLKGHKNHHLIIRAHEALHTAYTERRDQMSNPKRAYIVDWVRGWMNWVMDRVLRLESPGKCKGPDGAAKCQKQIEKRRARIKAGVAQALLDLEWEA